MNPIEYHHCENCKTPTTSESAYCQDCNPDQTRIILTFAKKKRTLENLRFIASQIHLKPSHYVMRLIEADIQRQIEEINKGMKRSKL